MLRTLVPAVLAMGLTSSAFATSTMTCFADGEVEGVDYSFNFIISNTAGSALVETQVKMDAGLGGVATERLDHSHVAQYWNDGVDFKAILVDDQAISTRFIVQTVAGPVPEGGGSPKYDGWVSINKEGTFFRRDLSCFAGF